MKKENINKLKGLEAARNVKRARCSVKGCNGQLKVVWSYKRHTALHDGHTVYFPGDCQVRKRVCTECKKVQKSVEIPLDRYCKDLDLIRKLKIALREYVGN